MGILNSKNLDSNEILKLEYEYAAETAFKANEDRVSIYSFFLTTVISVIGGLVAFNTNANSYKFAGILILLGVWALGIISSLKLIKLRMAWFGSLVTMQRIKDYYIGHGEKELPQAFKWHIETAPDLGNKWSISFLLYIGMFILSSIVLTIASSLILEIIMQIDFIRVVYFISIFLGIVNFVVGVYVWNKLLRR